MSSITAKVVADTEGVIPEARITTFEIYAPRFLLAEINTHRVIAKSAQSSRAIPVKKRIEMVLQDPYIPSTFGKNKPGMQATETLNDADTVAAEYRWTAALGHAVRQARTLEQLGVHKQLANRLLEPFAYFYGVLTATEWDNFWHLRRSEAAQPEFRELADNMFAAYQASTPRIASHHLPYCDDLGGHTIDTLLHISAARCARVSYKTFEGKTSTPDEDALLCQRLITEGHLSPFDHPAMCDTLTADKKHWFNPDSHRQFWGWIPYRVDVEGELGITCRRESYAEICQ